MTAPICPKHNAEMRRSDKGGFYCTKKLEDGSWCRERASSPEGTAPQVAPAAPQSDDRIAAAARRFAGTLFRGAGPEMADEAITLAIKAASAMKAAK